MEAWCSARLNSCAFPRPRRAYPGLVDKSGRWGENTGLGPRTLGDTSAPGENAVCEVPFRVVDAISASCCSCAGSVCYDDVPSVCGSRHGCPAQLHWAPPPVPCTAVGFIFANPRVHYGCWQNPYPDIQAGRGVERSMVGPTTRPRSARNPIGVPAIAIIPGALETVRRRRIHTSRETSDGHVV